MQNEILKPVLDTDEVAVPRYDIVGPNGAVIQQNVELRLKNEVVQEGTPYDEESVLPASLRGQLELPQSATPAEAFAAVMARSGGAVRKNRPPLTTDAESVGKLWVIPEMTFVNLMPGAVTQVASNWSTSTATVSVSGNTATAVGNASDSKTQIESTMLDNVSAGDKIFTQVSVKVNHDANLVMAELVLGSTVLATKSLSTPAAGATMTLQALTTAEIGGKPVLRVYATYNTAAVQSGKGFTVSAITVWNLTADMCEAQEGNEFIEAEAANYITTFGQFQAKEYEYSTWWWILRGTTDGVYLWARMYDEATSAVARAGTSQEAWMSPLRTQEFFTGKLATQSEAQGGSNNTKAMTPLRTQNFFDYRAGTDAEVAAGTNTTHWANPKQVAKAATTFRDNAIGKNCSTILSVDYFKLTTVTVNVGLTDLIHFYPKGSVVYNNQVFITGYRQVRASSSSNSYNYYFAVIAISLDNLTLTWDSGNLFSVYDSDYFNDLYPNMYTRTCISADASVVLIRYDGSSLAILDLKNKTVHYGISTSYLYGVFATANYVGYVYAYATTNTGVYYKNRNASGTTFSYKALGITVYAAASYLGLGGVSGDIVTFVYKSAADALSSGQFNIATDRITTGLSTVTATDIQPQASYTMQALNGYAFVPANASGVKGFIRVVASTGVMTSQLTSELYNTTFNDPGITYFGTYDNLMYFFGFQEQIDSSYAIYAFNRTTGALVSKTTLDSSSYRYQQSKSAHKWCEAIFQQPWLADDENVLDLTLGTVQPLRGPMYANPSQMYTYALGTYPNIFLGEMPDAPFVGLYTSRISTGTYTLSLTGAFSGPVKSIQEIQYVE